MNQVFDVRCIIYKVDKLDNFKYSISFLFYFVFHQQHSYETITITCRHSLNNSMFPINFFIIVVILRFFYNFQAKFQKILGFVKITYIMCNIQYFSDDVYQILCSYNDLVTLSPCDQILALLLHRCFIWIFLSGSQLLWHL